MKKVLCLLIVLLFLLTACSSVDKTKQEPVEEPFVVIQMYDSYLIVYYKDTKVMYSVSRTGPHIYTLLVDAEGKPLIYEGDNK